MTYKKIRIKYLSDIENVVKNGDWIDLRAAEDVELKKGEHKAIRLGVAMELPEGYEAYVVPRSSTFKNWGIIQTNSVGVIDEDYNGDSDEWHMSVIATRDAVIKKNERICQFRIMKKQPRIIFENVESLGNNNRGGFGSTGVI